MMFSYLAKPSRSKLAVVLQSGQLLLKGIPFLIALSFSIVLVIMVYLYTGFVITGLYNFLAGGIDTDRFSLVLFSPTTVIILLISTWIEYVATRRSFSLFKQRNVSFTLSLGISLLALGSFPFLMYWMSLLSRAAGLHRTADFLFQYRFPEIGFLTFLFLWALCGIVLYAILIHIRRNPHRQFMS